MLGSEWETQAWSSALRRLFSHVSQARQLWHCPIGFWTPQAVVEISIAVVGPYQAARKEPHMTPSQVCASITVGTT
jgi:hypothetical protein